MERIHQVELNKQENKESKEAVFNFPEIAALQEGMVNLTKKLRENIDAGKYDALVSDDVEGRIPTLVLRKIIKTRRPEMKINTHFIASGKTYLPKYGSKEYNKLVLHLKEVTSGEENILLVTEYTHSGVILVELAHALEEAGVHNIDEAVLNSLNSEDYLQRHLGAAGSVFVGTRDGSTYNNERAAWYAGVGKTKEYDPKLHLLRDVIAKEGREKFMSMREWREIFGIEKGDTIQQIDQKTQDPEKNAKYDARAKEHFSETELEELRTMIIKAREDVQTMSEEVIRTVWKSK